MGGGGGGRWEGGELVGCVLEVEGMWLDVAVREKMESGVISRGRLKFLVVSDTFCGKREGGKGLGTG